jgi:hypothetical protein
MNLFAKKQKGGKKVKKQVIVDPELYRTMKAKMFLDGMTFSSWLEEQMRKEVNAGNPRSN